MKQLKDKILKEGIVLSENVLKVDSFINHQIDPRLVALIGKEFKKLFSDLKIDKVLTIESSGIVFGYAVALELNVPLVFAKKKKPSTMENNYYQKKVKSFTKNSTYDMTVGAKFINQGENILIIDDFMAHGQAAAALCQIITEANAKVGGIGIVIEKGFQNGGDMLRKQGYRIESLAIIEKMDQNQLIFRNQ